MQLKTILNCVHRQPGFVYGHVEWFTEGEHLALRVEVRPHGRSRGRCSKCLKKRPGYDTLSPRQFAFVPLWGILVYLVYAMRRVGCPRCGVVVEAVPWADSKERMTNAYAWFLAGWAKRLSWKEVAVAFHTSWDTVLFAPCQAPPSAAPVAPASGGPITDRLDARDHPTRVRRVDAYRLELSDAGQLQAARHRATKSSC